MIGETLWAKQQEQAAIENLRANDPYVAWLSKPPIVSRHWVCIETRASAMAMLYPGEQIDTWQHYCLGNCFEQVFSPPSPHQEKAP